MQPTTTQNNNNQQTIVNFHQQYQSMKNYLLKKRFTFVYEQCMKFYTKNNTMFSNHEVLILIKMIFYILKKKMIARCNNGGKVTAQGLHEIYSMMTNVYMSWQAVLMTQMTAQQPQFFSMLFRMRSYRTNRSQIVQRPHIDTLIFKPKPDFVITKKINLQYKTYNFFKQLLRMTINSITIMLPSLQIQKISRLVTTIKKAQKIMQQFQQHLFPIQKIQFYLLKCRIYEHASRQLGLCLKFEFKYEFPMGLFQLIYKNLQKWKQGKVLHYINLLIKVLFVSVRNQLMSVEDVYILGWQIKLLLRIVKKRDTLMQQIKSKQNKRQRQSKQNKNKLYQLSQQNNIATATYDTNPTKISSQYPTQQEQRQYLKKQQQKQQKQNGKVTPMTMLRIVLMQIDKYLTQKKQINHILQCYMLDEYCRYRMFDPNQQLVDQIPVLVDQLYKKKKKAHNKKKNDYNNDINKQQQHNILFNSQKSQPLLLSTKNKLNNLSKKSTLKQSKQSTPNKYNINYLTQQQPSTNSYDNNLFQDKIDKFYNKKKQIDNNKKGKDIMMRNIMNVKVNNKNGKVLLKLDKKQRSLVGMDTKRTGVTMVSSSSSQLFGQAQFNSKNQLIRSILTSTLTNPQLPSLSPPLTHPIALLQQSSSDSQNQLSQQFQTRRRQQISTFNSKYYKATNVNYLFNKNNNTKSINIINDSKQFLDGLQRNNQSQQQQQQKGINKLDSNDNGQGIIKVSQQIEYQQIKMLDEVIKQKVLTLLDVEMQTTYTANNNRDNDISSRRNNRQSNSNATFSGSLMLKEKITNFHTAKTLTQKLLKQVDQLNQQQKLLKDRLKTKMQNGKLMNSLYRLQQQSIDKSDKYKVEQSSLSSQMLIRDLHEVYSLQDNLQEKSQHYQQLYRKLLNINNNTYQFQQTNKKPLQKQTKKLSSTIKHYAHIHKLYTRQQKHNDNNKLSIIGEMQQQQLQNNTYRYGWQQQQYQQQNQHQIMTKNKAMLELQDQIREKQRQLKFISSNNKNQLFNDTQRNNKKDDVNNNTDKKQIALRQQFDHLRVDVGRSRFNQTNFLNINKKLAINLNNNNNNQHISN